MKPGTYFKTRNAFHELPERSSSLAYSSTIIQRFLMKRVTEQTRRSLFLLSHLFLFSAYSPAKFSRINHLIHTSGVGKKELVHSSRLVFSLCKLVKFSNFSFSIINLFALINILGKGRNKLIIKNNFELRNSAFQLNINRPFTFQVSIKQKTN